MRIFFYLSLFFFCQVVFCQTESFDKAQQSFSEANYSEAYSLFESVAGAFQTSGQLDQYVKCNLRMASCQVALGNYATGKTLSQNTLSYIIEILPDNKLLRAESQMLIGESDLNLGRNDLALESLLEAEHLYGEEVSIESAECLENLGVIYWNNGNVDIATQYHERALGIRSNLFGKRSLLAGDSYNNLGLVKLGSDPFQATLYLTRALQIYEENLGPNHPKVAFCLTNLSRANTDQNNFDEALEQLGKVSDIWNIQYENDHPNKAFTLSNIGRVHEALNELPEAIHSQNEALKMYLNLYGSKHPEVANTYFILGNLYQSENEWKEAVSYYQSSIYANLYDQNSSSNQDLPSLEGYYNADILLSSLVAKAKVWESLHLDKSLKAVHLEHALSTLSKADTLIGQIRQLRLNEKDKLRLGQVAKEIYESAIRISLILSEQPFVKNKYKEMAFSFCERSKSAVLLEAISETKAKGFAGIPAGLLDIEDSLKNEISIVQRKLIENSGNSQESALKSQLFEYQSSYRSFISKLEQEYPKYFDLKYKASVATVTELQEVLNTEEGILSYFEGEKRFYTFLITKKDISISNQAKSESYNKNITGLRNGIKYHVNKVFFKSSQSLYQELIPNIPKSISHLLIVPDGALGTIPFEALISSKDIEELSPTTRYFIHDFNVSYDYSTTLFLERKEAIANFKNDQNDILLIAPVVFAESTGLPPLAGTEDEVRAIKYLFKGNQWQSESKIKDMATEAFVKNADLTNYKYVHFATHGVVHESKPELSRIYLGGTQGEDGSLYSGEIYNLKINAELVTLSACETGLGKVAKGEGIVGLSRALLYAGADNLIVSLWQVADQSTSQLMIDFYTQHLFAEEKSNFSSALRASKLKMLQSDNYQNPYYWAPFILVGI